DHHAQTEGGIRWPEYDMASGYLCFFFSSRRRHTRLQGDWSSDVCSSDLGNSSIDYVEGIVAADEGVPTADAHRRGGTRSAVVLRSEERRVGKEWRSRWGREGDKKREVMR